MTWKEITPTPPNIENFEEFPFPDETLKQDKFRQPKQAKTTAKLDQVTDQTKTDDMVTITKKELEYYKSFMQQNKAKSNLNIEEAPTVSTVTDQLMNLNTPANNDDRLNDNVNGGEGINTVNNNNVSKRPTESSKPITEKNIETDADKYPFYERIHEPETERPFVCNNEDVKYIANCTDLYSRKKGIFYPKLGSYGDRESNHFIFDETKRDEIMDNRNGDNTVYSENMLYETDQERYRTYSETDSPMVDNAHNHLKDVDFNKPSVDESSKFNYEFRQTVAADGKKKMIQNHK